MRRGESMNIDEVWLHLTNTGTDWPNGNYRSTIASFTPNEESSQEKKEIELKIQLSSAEVRHLDDSELWTKFWRGELAEAPNFVVIVETNTRIYFGKHPTCQSVIVHVFISKLTIPLPIYVFFKRPLMQEYFAEILLHFDRLRISRVIGCLKWNNLKPFVLDRSYSALEKTSASHNI